MESGSNTMEAEIERRVGFFLHLAMRVRGRGNGKGRSYRGKHADENRMGGTLECAVGEGDFVLGYVQLGETINSTLNEVVIVKFSSINRSSQLKIITFV